VIPRLFLSVSETAALDALQLSTAYRYTAFHWRSCFPITMVQGVVKPHFATGEAQERQMTVDLLLCIIK